MKVLAVLTTFACLLLVDAEPPVTNYLPPSTSYGTPNFGGGSGGHNQGGFGGSAPSSQYGPPSGGGHGGFGGSAPSSAYGAPAITGAVFKQPQTSYGAPSAGGYSNGGGNGGYSNGGYGGHGNENNEPARYNFEYNVQDYQSGNDFGHMEQRDGDRTQGKYYVLLPDGRKQIVTYEADEHGYRPTITYEGTANAGGYNGNAQQQGHGGNQFNGY